MWYPVLIYRYVIPGNTTQTLKLFFEKTQRKDKPRTEKKEIKKKLLGRKIQLQTALLFVKCNLFSRLSLFNCVNRNIKSIVSSLKSTAVDSWWLIRKSWDSVSYICWKPVRSKKQFSRYPLCKAITPSWNCYPIPLARKMLCTNPAS